MRRCLFFLVMAGLWPTGVLGKGLELRLVSEYVEHLPGEAMYVKVSIKNIADQPVILGQSPDWIRFLVYNSDLKPVARRGAVPTGDVFIVPARQVTERFFKLGPYFDISEPGRYVIQTHVHVRAWKMNIQANAVQVRVIRGVPVASLAQGISDPLNPNQPPEIRKYTLVRKRNDGRIHLYLRVEEEMGKNVYGVLPLGGMVSFARPEFYLDKAGHAHALFQNGSRNYLYCRVDPKGELLKRETHEIYRGKRPVFGLNDQGDLEVNGGRRVDSPSDIPRTKKPRVRAIEPLPSRPGKRPTRVAPLP